MVGAASGNGGQVGDGDDLASPGGFGELASDGMGGFAADVGVDFVEYEKRDSVGLGEDHLDGEHDAGDFAGGSDGAQGAHGFARVRRESKFGPVESGRGRGVEGLQRDGKRTVAEAEGPEFVGDGGGEFSGGIGPALSEGFAEFAEPCFGFGDLAFDLGFLAVAVP